MTGMYWLLAAAAAALVGAEVIEWCGPAQRFLVRRAAAKLPPEHRERYTEEWMAELDEIPGGPLTRFLFTASMLVRSRRLASELRRRNRDLADLLVEMQIRRMRAVLLQRPRPNYSGYERVIVAEGPDGERHAWRMEGRLLTPVIVPDEELGLAHVRPTEIKVLTRLSAAYAADSLRTSTSPSVGEVSLPSPMYETGL